ncbi:MAG: hypothetical protein CYPHOPRED_005372 [Cyphobasidiales sp. Tagirdzhanova-0007]|nr:MAG: hypothetical protein CYPHOPRED_005372 [Cyphobasidiales sp. Tagirdzhanova-0007]
MLEGIRPGQLHFGSRTTSVLRHSESADIDPATSKGGVSKWKNKLKSFLTSPLPNAKPLSPPSIRANDLFVGDISGYENDFVANDSYEARLSRLVGDLENVDYGAAVEQDTQWTDADKSADLHPFACAATPTNFSNFADFQPPVNIHEPFDSFPPSLDGYGLDDVQVPALYSPPSPSYSGQPTSIALSAIESITSSIATPATSSGEQSAYSAPELDKTASRSNGSHNALFLGDAPSIPVPFNSPVNGTNMTESSIASLSMPFSFEDLKSMGLVEGGSLDIGGGADEDDFTKLLHSSQMHAGPSSANSRDSTLDFSQFDLSLFPIPSVVPSPFSEASSGPSPALSYGESSTSNTSLEDGHVDATGALQRPAPQMNALFAQVAPLVKTPTHSPKPSVSSSVPPTPSSFKSGGSAPSSPYRRPIIHASALTWRVAPTVISPRSNITVESRPLRTIPSVPFFANTDPFAFAPDTRLKRITTVSSPELKRRWQDDEDLSSSGMEARFSGCNQLQPAAVLSHNLHNRPIAGRRRVGVQMAPSLGPTRSISHSQLYQSPAHHHPTALPPLPTSQPSSTSDNVLHNLYTQIDARTYLCMLQGCQRTFASDHEVAKYACLSFCVSIIMTVVFAVSVK